MTMTTMRTNSPFSTLAYHRISPRFIPGGTWVTPRQLDRHLDAVAAAGIPFISADEFLAASPQAGPGVLLTFDDGTADIHTHRENFSDRGLRPVLFMPVDFVGRSNTWEWSIPGRRTAHCGAGQLRELADSGWEIGLHGSSHCDLTRLSAGELEREIGGGHNRLEAITGRPVRLFSYPFGKTDDRVAAAVKAAGFSAAFVLTAGAQEGNPLRLPRRPVYCIDSASAVVAKVADPAGLTWAGRWQRWQEASAHGVGRGTARWLR